MADPIKLYKLLERTTLLQNYDVTCNDAYPDRPVTYCVIGAIAKELGYDFKTGLRGTAEVSAWIQTTTGIDMSQSVTLGKYHASLEGALFRNNDYQHWSFAYFVTELRRLDI